MSDPIIERVRELAKLQDILSEKCARVNVTIPDFITTTSEEQQVYRLLYQMKCNAERHVQTCALKLAFDAPGLIERYDIHKKAEHRTDCTCGMCV